MIPKWTTRLRRVFFFIGLVASAWAILVMLTGGFAVRFDSVRLSSRSPQNALVVALISGVAVWLLSRSDTTHRVREDWVWLERIVSTAIPWPLKTILWLVWAHPPATMAAAGFGLLIYQWAGARPMWLDEEMIALNLHRRPLTELVGPLWLGQSAPLGWLALERAIVLALGNGERALRLLPLLFGIATSGVALWIGYRWMTRVAATLLVAFCLLGQWLSYHALELKPYSADAFWGLLLPALAAWTLEPGSQGPVRLTRAAIWWILAAVGLWFANGALFVAPGCALVLLASLWRRNGLRSALIFALLGLLWLPSFGLDYLLAIRHARSSDYLRSYWSFALPAEWAGFGETLRWVGAQLEPMAIKPGGTGLWLSFWLAATCGFLFGGQPALGAILATVPISAFLLAALGLVPLYERLSLWTVPALYTGIALVADRTVRLGHEFYLQRRWVGLGLAAPIVVALSVLSIDLVRNGAENLYLYGPLLNSHHGLDDRGGVRWLMRQRQPGDVLMTTHLGLPAVWWYGEIPFVDGKGDRQPDGSPILEVGYAPSGPDCDGNQLRDALADRRRVLLYLGFRFDDVPKGFDDLLLGSLGELGSVAVSRGFSDVGRAAVINLGTPPVGDGLVPARPAGVETELGGCVSVQPAGRW